MLTDFQKQQNLVESANIAETFVNIRQQKRVFLTTFKLVRLLNVNITEHFSSAMLSLFESFGCSDNIVFLLPDAFTQGGQPAYRHSDAYNVVTLIRLYARRLC